MSSLELLTRLPRSERPISELSAEELRWELERVERELRHIRTRCASSETPFGLTGLRLNRGDLILCVTCRKDVREQLS